MLAAVFAVLFLLSLLPGRKPLCLRFAERISDGILPDGAEAYCRRLTWVWFGILALLTAVNAGYAIRISPAGDPRFGWGATLVPTVWSAGVIALVFFVERRIRNRRFREVFHTSGSTGRSKTVVKTFESLAREVAFHRRRLRAEVPAANDPETRILATIESGHMYGRLWRDLLPKTLGLVCDPEVILSPESLIAKMRAAKRVILVTTPSFLDRFTSYAENYEMPANCAEVVTSGALCTHAVAMRTRAVFGIAPREIFGSTETGGVASRRQTPGGDDLWEVFPEVKVAAENGRLAVRSPFSFRRRYVMGDGVELAADARSFRLLGRMDRLVKINEERVNLAEMEERVRALGYRDCALAKLAGRRGDCLGLLLVAAPGRPRESALDLRRRFLDVFPRGTVPRRFRFVRVLPRNPQGKVRADEVTRLLESELVEPEMRVLAETDSLFEAEMAFDPAAPYFQGHFPAAPILPGVVQLGLAVRGAQTFTGGGKALRTVKKLKFVHVIEPGVLVRLRLERRPSGEIGFSYMEGEALCSSGVLEF